MYQRVVRDSLCWLFICSALVSCSRYSELVDEQEVPEESIQVNPVAQRDISLADILEVYESFDMDVGEIENDVCLMIDGQRKCQKIEAFVDPIEPYDYEQARVVGETDKILQPLIETKVEANAWVDEDGDVIEEYDYYALRASTSSLSESNPYAQVLYAYFEALETNYEASEKLMESACAGYAGLCDDLFTDVQIQGSIYDTDGEPIPGVTITELGTGTNTLSDDEGKYSFSISGWAPGKMRFSAEKIGFSGDYFDLILFIRGDKRVTHDFYMHHYEAKIIIDDTTHKIVSGDAGGKKDGTYTLTTTNSIYTIPFDSFVREDESVYDGKVEIYLYEFQPGTRIDMLNASIFSNARGYIGHQLVSFGMPFLTAHTPDGERLFVPYDAGATIKVFPYTDVTILKAAELTEEQIDELMEVSAQGGYPISSDWTWENNTYINLPTYWQLDQRDGVWLNVGMRLLDRNGTLEAPFFTLKKVKTMYHRIN